MNQVVLVGRITKDIEVTATKNDKKICKLDIAVTRNYKNVNGEYETDFIPCVLWNGIAENTAEYCKKGDIVGIRGRIQTENKNIQIMVERLTFLSSKTKKEEN